jgi:predicted RNase H-like HicB family nuclease
VKSYFKGEICMNETNDISVFQEIVEALQEGVQWARGEKQLPVTILEAPTTTPIGQSRMQEYAVLYVQGGVGWQATVPDLPGCEAIGDSLEEAQNLIRYFIKTHLQALHRAGQPIPPSKTRAEQVSIAA